MSALSMPMPKADVATITSVRPAMKSSCAWVRTRLPSPAWYAAALSPASARSAAYASAALRVRT